MADYAEDDDTPADGAVVSEIGDLDRSVVRGWEHEIVVVLCEHFGFSWDGATQRRDTFLQQLRDRQGAESAMLPSLELTALHFSPYQIALALAGWEIGDGERAVGATVFVAPDDPTLALGRGRSGD